MLHKRGVLNDAQVQELYRLGQTRKEPLIKLLLDKGWVDESKIRSILRKDLMVDEVQLAEFQVDPAVAELLPRGFCERQWVIPLKLEALRLGVSDIHIQPRTKNVVVRYRIDGVLADKIQIPHHLYPALVSRIKVMAELNIAERRRPQDGRIAVKTPTRVVDLRISTMPTIAGEKVVMRILDRNSAIHRIEELGFAPDDLDKVLTMVTRPQGIILATGPTGSGKTTTLYSLLQHDATPTKNYITIEDPVEYY